jgi:hypothetical protein
MTEVFLSYSREDLATARQVAECLQQEGWSVFWDRLIPVGQTWDSLIDNRLSRASCVVVLWSSASVASDWVRAEATAAAERGVLAPAVIDATPPPLRFRMIQTADLVGWNGRRDHGGLADLIAAVRARAGGDVEPTLGESADRSRDVQRSDPKPLAIADIETGADRGRSLVLTQAMTSVTIGRSHDCDFVIDELYISRAHCRLEIQVTRDARGREKYGFTLIDFGSVAGTIVNNERIRQVDLHNGDSIQIGSVRFRFRIVDESVA